MLSCKICEIFKSNYFQEYLLTTASNLYLKKTPKHMFSCEFYELFKNTYFVEHLWTTGAEPPVRRPCFNKVASLTV